MPTIVDYASLTQAILDFTHRPTLSAFSDYFIQGAQSEINDDIFENNFQSGIRLMENAYPPTAISANGTAPVPADWLAPKLMTILGQDGSQPGLEFKDPEWIYNRYPQRQATGLPKYIARDVQSGGGSLTQPAFVAVTITATGGQTAFPLGAAPVGGQMTSVVLDGASLVPTVDYSVSGTTLNLVNAALAGQTFYALFLSANANIPTSNTSVFIFGPYPDSGYTIQGTYYQAAPLLSASQTTNWMVSNAPMMLHACCMRKAAEFLKDPEMFEGWNAIYTDLLKKLIARDTSERYGSGPLVINTAP